MLSSSRVRKAKVFKNVVFLFFLFFFGVAPRPPTAAALTAPARHPIGRSFVKFTTRKKTLDRPASHHICAGKSAVDVKVQIVDVFNTHASRPDQD